MTKAVCLRHLSHCENDPHVGLCTSRKVLPDIILKDLFYALIIREEF